ncbi:TauD/TfdA family dioxygenase [Streptomyces sp. NL15-2K]|uniref:TauD/TfdA family dioxygenase n=1 Tax=Streptomyces sp. NL15-2K TaxID=376149 RepID=UPI000F578F0D|nr:MULTISPECIES: TauD/TfdA family dioxygenase [Actinomycetes]WKX15178.1 TauD/TfdA family dioxygenase [Kutzneria buriramensis]GCB52270.1 hypothetical protein SNL152K_9626 [Streptomyces sp. NL15-2K]
MTTSLDLEPATGPAAWRGDELAGSDAWIHHLTTEEVAELEAVGRRFVDDDPDLRTVRPEDYPLDVCAEQLRSTAQELDRGRGFLLVRGLRTQHYSDALSAAIFYVMGLHLGEPMRQNELGDLLDHVMATTDKTLDDPTALGSRTRDKLNFHSDSSDIVGLMCLRPSKAGGASSLVSGATLYNEVLARRPDLAPLLFEPFHHDWYKQDHDAPQRYYTSPICSRVDGVFSIYGGNRMIFSAQDYPEVPRLTEAQIELLHLIDDVAREPGVALDMDFRPGDVQWLLNYAAMHSRTEYQDFPELQRRRHLLRLWLRHDSGRPVVPGFGRNVVQGRTQTRTDGDADDRGNFSIGTASIPRLDWGV